VSAVCIVLDPSPKAHQERDNRADQEHDKEDFRDSGRADRDSAKAEECGNQRDDKEDNGIVEHVCTSNDLEQRSAVAKVSADQIAIAVGERLSWA
jgi:hypothetical protein